jgi:hypothetical protein
MQQRMPACLQLLRGSADAVGVGNFELDTGLWYLSMRGHLRVP